MFCLYLELTILYPLAESLLKQEESKPQYSLQLLKIVAGSNFAVTTRLAAALAFKNYVRLNYVVRFSLYSSYKKPPGHF